MSEPQAATVRFGRLESRGLILGLSAAQTAAVGVAVIVAVLAEYTAGAAGILLTAPVWATATVLALVPVAGRPLLSWLPVVGHWGLRRRLSGTRYLARVDRMTATGVEIPGVPGRLAVVDAPRSGAALILDPRTSTVTALLAVSGAGFLLADDGTRERRVAGWGRLLAGLCQQPSVVRIQVLQRCLPGAGGPVRRWWAEHALADAPWAARVLADLVADAEDATARYECFLVIALRQSRAGRRATSAAALADADGKLEAVLEAARAADLLVHGWVTRRRFAAAIRATYDPRGAAASDTGDIPDPDSATGPDPAPVIAGPMALEEDWARVRTDSAHHCVYWIQEWPRSDVHTGFLQPLLLAPGARRAFSLTAEPLPPAKALRDIRRAKVEHAADAGHRARVGRVEDEATRAEVGDLARREAELVAGHGDLRFVGLLTVSAPSIAELEAACAATESAAARAMCELRRLTGQQGRAFAAGAVPLARGTT